MFSSLILAAAPETLPTTGDLTEALPESSIQALLCNQKVWRVWVCVGAECYAPNVRLESLLILEAYRWETLAYPNMSIPSPGPSQEQTRKQVCLATNQMDKHSKHIVCRGNATK